MKIKELVHGHVGKTAVIIGGGVIGSSWAALFLVNGLKVIVSDPDPQVAHRTNDFITSALPSLEALGYVVKGITDQLFFEADSAKAVSNADLIQECGPETVDFKQKLWKKIEECAPKDALFFSSSSGIPASVQAVEMSNQSRLLVAHPFNPPHLMPLVEIVPAPGTDPKVTALAVRFYQDIGKVALEIKKEIGGFVANRLQAAIFQEAVFLVAEGVVTLDELDDVVTNSLGIRWATSGPFLSFHLGGGAAGLSHFIEHLGPPMEAAWRHLGVASFDQDTKTLLAEQLSESYGKASFVQLSKVRDEKEVVVIKSLAKAFQ